MRYIIFFFLFVFALRSLGQTAIYIPEPYGDDFIASELIAEVNVVELQLEKYGMITPDMELKVDGDNYFVLDNKFTQRVYRFGSDGALLNTIGGQAKGNSTDDLPVLNNPVKFSIDPFNHQVEIYNFESSLINRFNYEGEINDKFSLNGNFSDFVCDKSGNYWLYLGWNNSESQYRLMKTDRNGKVIDRQMRLISKCTPIEGFSFYSFDRQICFWELLGNKTYAIENSSISTKYVFNFGNYDLPLNYHIMAGDDSYMMINQKGYYTVKKYIENEDFAYFFLNFNRIDQREMLHVIHDKKTNQVFVYAENSAIGAFDKAQAITKDNELLFLVTPRKMRQLMSSGADFIPAPFVGVSDEVRRMRNPIVLKLKLKSLTGVNDKKETESMDSQYFEN
jgi:hypothetical protein